MILDVENTDFTLHTMSTHEVRAHQLAVMVIHTHTHTYIHIYVCICNWWGVKIIKQYESWSEVKSLSCVPLFATPWTAASLLCPWNPRQGYWRGLPFPSPGDLPNPGIEPGSPAFQADTLTSEPPGTPLNHPSGLLTCHKSTSPLLPSSSYVISQGYLHLLECFGTPPASGKCHCFGDT